jgi:PAS domain S-box-containing protein
MQVHPNHEPQTDPPLTILLQGVTRRDRARLEQSLARAGVSTATLADHAEWVMASQGSPAAGPVDALVVCAGHAPAETLEMARSLRGGGPAVALLAWVPTADPECALAFLRAGFHECFRRPAEFPRVLEQALARLSARARGADTGPGDPSQQDRDPYDGLFPNLYDWIYVVGIGEDGRMTFETVNPPLNAGGGFLNPDFAGKAPEECLPGASAALLLAHFRKVLEEGRPLQFEEEYPVGGRSRNFQTILTPVRNKWGRIHRLAGISRDITALKQAQAALQASEARLNHALEGTQQGLWDWDLQSGRMYRSPRWHEMLGLDPGALAETVEAGLQLVHPEDRMQTEAAMHAHIEGRLPRFQAEYRIRTRTGEWLWFYDAGKVVSLDPNGQPARIAGLCTDITDRRRAEESLRALVGGVVHEIRNPVYGISINLDALEATFGAEPRFAPFVTALRESADRIASLMNDLRDYGEPRTLNPEPSMVRPLVEEAARACEPLAQSKGCRLQLDLEDDRLVLPLNARRIHQVFRNLLENALHHAPDGSMVRLAGRKTQAEGHDWWTFTVEDEGPGFEADVLLRAFEPFYTRRRGGTGLGLSIVKRVVEEHGGDVEASNRPSGGARLQVRLPAPRLRMELMGARRG